MVRPGQWPADFARQESDREALLLLAHLEGLTPREIRDLAWKEGTARSCVRSVRLGLAGSDLDRRRLQACEPTEVRAALERCEARLMAPGDDDYPDALLDLHDPPGWLFVRGIRWTPNEGATVSIVGARNCSPYGIEAAEALGRGLAAAGVTVVSGAARGIDAAAHRGALSVSGPTVAVLGSGIDVPYPSEHAGMLDRIAACGAIVSEYPPGFRAHQRRFPARNRIVAALARAVVVVEGAPGSGSLITAEFAQDLHRDLLAVPGPVTSELSSAPNALIHDGAGLVRDAPDVLAALHLLSAGPEDDANGESAGSGGEGGSPPSIPEDLSDPEARALGAVVGPGQVVDQVAAASGLTAADALRALVSLELRGLVSASGGRYRRLMGTEDAGKPSRDGRR